MSKPNLDLVPAIAVDRNILLGHRMLRQADRMDHPVNGAARTHAGDADIIAGYLAKLAARMSGLCQVRTVTGRVPCLHVASQLDPEFYEYVLCNFATNPPGYMTAFGHPLGTAADPGAAATALADLLHVDHTHGS